MSGQFLDITWQLKRKDFSSGGSGSQTHVHVCNNSVAFIGIGGYAVT
jgi:hypothetical protein